MVNRNPLVTNQLQTLAHQRYAYRHAEVMDSLPVPPDVDLASDRYQANCGPVAFAAALGLSVLEVISNFPQFPQRPWTNLQSMTKALDRLRVPWEINEKTLPGCGLALIQWEGPWMRSRTTALRYTHWVAVYDEYFFDINWPGWLPQPIWEQMIVPQFIEFEPRITGWAVSLSVGISGQADRSWPRPATRPL